MFGLFGKKKKTTLYDEIRDFVAYQKVSKLIEKANNLLKLGRREEAVNIFTDAEQVSINSVNNSPDSFQANLLLAFFTRKHAYMTVQKKFSITYCHQMHSTWMKKNELL